MALRVNIHDVRNSLRCLHTACSVNCAGIALLTQPGAECWDCNVCSLQHGSTFVILRLAACPLAQRLTRSAGAAAVLRGATTGDVGRTERIALNGIARLLLAFLYQDIDDIHVDRCSEDVIQLLFGRLAQDTLTALVGEEYLEGCGTTSTS